MRNYIFIEKTKHGLFLAEGTGSEIDLDYDESEHWNEGEPIENKEKLFEKIKEILNL